MDVTQFIVNVTSEQPERLGAFYRDVLGLTPRPEVGESAFNVAGATLIIDGHSETHGAAREPQRVLLNFFVEDIAAEQGRLEERGVKFTRSQGKEFWGGVISTFADPDGNICQIIEYRPS